MTAPHRRRWWLIALLVSATGLFAYGVLHERALSHRAGGESAAQRTSERAAAAAPAETTAEHAGESGDAGAAQPSAPSRPAALRRSETVGEGRVLGVDLESTPMIVAAIAAGIALAIAVATGLGTIRLVLLIVAGIALAWAALDIRDVVHQVNESRAGLAVVDALVTGLHLAAALVALGLARRRPPPAPVSATAADAQRFSMP